MVRRRRNNMEITADILRIAKNGAKKTRIVYRANLNFKILHEYLDELGEAGLIANDQEGNGLIKTTERGMQYLEHYRKFNQFLTYLAPQTSLEG